jgi:cell wall-associated NlpC family hydrolase
MQTLLFTLVFNMVGLNFYMDGVDNIDETPVFDYSSPEMRRDCMVDSLMNRAHECIGTRYQYGGSSKAGFDCSGFMNYVYSAFGISLPRSSSEIAKLGVKVEFNDLQPGDLVFFNGRKAGSTQVGHVGMVVQKTKNGFKMIHASVSKGVRIDDYQDVYYRTRFLFGKRLELID